MSERRDVRRVLDHDRFRKKREDDTVSIRKQKREEINLKRRMVAPSMDSIPSAPITTTPQTDVIPNIADAGVPTTSPSAVLAKMPVEVGPNEFQNPTDWIAAFKTSDPQNLLKAAYSIRRVLSLERSPPIDAVIKAGCLPYLVQCLGAVGNEKLQFEAAWALTNVASGESRHTRALVQCGAVKPLLGLLNAGSWEIREQAVWALGNVAGDGAELRDQLLQLGAMQELIKMMSRLLQETVPVSLVRNTAWTLSNMYRGKPSPPLHLVQPGLPLLKVLLTHPDDEVVIDTIWAVSYATECNAIDKPTPSAQMPSVDERIDAVAGAGILPEVHRFLSAQELSKALPAVRTFGNILTGSAKYTDLVLQMNILPPFLGVLKRKNRVIRKEVLWALSNVAAGTSQHVQALIDAGVIDTAFTVVTTCEYELQKEAGWLISNAAVCANPEQVQAMVDKHKLLESLAAIIKLPDTALLKMALSSIETVLQHGSDINADANPYALKLEELDVPDRLIALQSHKNQKIYDLSVAIARDYFGFEDEEESEFMDDEHASVDETSSAPQDNPNALNFGPSSSSSAFGGFSFGQGNAFSFNPQGNQGQGPNQGQGFFGA